MWLLFLVKLGRYIKTFNWIKSSCHHCLPPKIYLQSTYSEVSNKHRVLLILFEKIPTKCLSCIIKGQLISKWFLGSSISSKKRTNKFDFTTMIPQVDMFSFVFLRKSTTPKKRFEINWPLEGRQSKEDQNIVDVVFERSRV